MPRKLNVATQPPVPAPTLRRLPAYRRFVKTLQEKGARAVSCSLIGGELGLDPTQVRKDLETTGIVGKPKVGYPVGDLINAIEKFLGWDKTRDAFLVGAGPLGRALLGYESFPSFGLRIVRVFDVDHNNIGEWLHGQEVFPLGFLPDLARKLGVEIGILTVPSLSAQLVANQMVQGGITAIWNFAPVALRLPEDVIIQNEDFYYSMAALSCKMERRSASRRATGDTKSV